jgi:hypothetical protein
MFFRRSVMPTEKKTLRKELLAFLSGGNAHMTFDEVIDRFPRDGINRKAPHVPYTAWHLLEHMRIAQWDIAEFIRNPKHVSPAYPDGYRPGADAHADWARWEKTVKDFRADLKALEDMVKDEKTDLFGPIPHAKGYTIFREILVAADHNAYHLGELAMLRQMLELWPDNAPYLTGSGTAV